MRAKYLLFFLYVLLLFSSCTRIKNRVYIEFEDQLRDLSLAEAQQMKSQNTDYEKRLNRILNRLTPSARQLPWPYTIYAADSQEINALCLPGGVILVFEGLIKRMPADEELASVIAHEMAHAQKHDAAAVWTREMGLQLVLSQIPGLGGTGRDIVHYLTASGFSRNQERRADIEGLRILSRAEIHPKHMAAAFKKMEQWTGNMPALMKYMSSHPDFSERRQTAEKAAAAYRGRDIPVLTQRRAAAK